MTKNIGIFLDRDGVINRVIFRNGLPASPRRIEEFIICEKVGDVLERFRKEGFLNIIVTNQPDIARGFMDEKVLNEMHRIIKEKLPVNDIFVCPHDDADNCQCRKPKPGMILEAGRKWNIDLGQSFMIGDSFKDIEAGKKAGCKTILILTDYNKGAEGDYIVPDLYRAMEVILNEKRK